MEIKPYGVMDDFAREAIPAAADRSNPTQLQVCPQEHNILRT
jgi:hypothetical protein